jgi:hypothetical protein
MLIPALIRARREDCLLIASASFGSRPGMRDWLFGYAIAKSSFPACSVSSADHVTIACHHGRSLSSPFDVCVPFSPDWDDARFQQLARPNAAIYDPHRGASQSRSCANVNIARDIFDNVF